MIIKTGDNYQVLSRDRSKVLATENSLSNAEKRLAQIEYYKSKDKVNLEEYSISVPLSVQNYVKSCIPSMKGSPVNIQRLLDMADGQPICPQALKAITPMLKRSIEGDAGDSILQWITDELDHYVQ